MPPPSPSYIALHCPRGQEKNVNCRATAGRGQASTQAKPRPLPLRTILDTQCPVRVTPPGNDPIASYTQVIVVQYPAPGTQHPAHPASTQYPVPCLSMAIQAAPGSSVHHPRPHPPSTSTLDAKHQPEGKSRPDTVTPTRTHSRTLQRPATDARCQTPSTKHQAPKQRTRNERTTEPLHPYVHLGNKPSRKSL